jgi:hypothetical protein
MADELQYKIGLTIAGLTRVTWYGIPDPNGNLYLPYSVVELCGNSDAKGYGHARDTWNWETLNQDGLNELLSLFDYPTDASKDLFIRTYKDNKARKNPANFQVKVYRPVDGSGKQPIPNSRLWYSNISLNFGHMIEV